MADRTVPVVEVTPRKHPNAEKLTICDVMGYQVVTGKGEFPEGVTRKAVFVEPDFVVPDTNEWAWLKGKRRIRPCKLRGERSEGVLVPCAGDLPVGKDMAKVMGIVKWESPTEYNKHGSERIHTPRWSLFRPGSWVNALRFKFNRWLMAREMKKATPPYGGPEYDVENYKRYPVLRDGEHVVVTEKIHGTNARYVWSSKTQKLHYGSRTCWKHAKEGNWWTNCAKQNPWIEALCKRHPDVVFYGEIYGPSVQELGYGLKPGELRFALFDIRENREWASWARRTEFWFKDDAVRTHWAPIIMEGRWSSDIPQWAAMSEKSVLAKRNCAEHICEGFVVEPVEPRTERGLGRVKVKLITDAYLGAS